MRIWKSWSWNIKPNSCIKCFNVKKYKKATTCEPTPHRPARKLTGWALPAIPSSLAPSQAFTRVYFLTDKNHRNQSEVLNQRHTHPPPRTHPGRCPGGNPLPVRVPHARPRCHHRPARLRCPGNGRAPPLPLAPPLRAGEEEAPPTQGCVCGAVLGADHAHLAGSGSRWEQRVRMRWRRRLARPCVSLLPPPPRPEPPLPGGREWRGSATQARSRGPPRARLRIGAPALPGSLGAGGDSPLSPGVFPPCSGCSRGVPGVLPGSPRRASGPPCRWRPPPPWSAPCRSWCCTRPGL